MREDVGVVVIGRNEGDRLVRCLQSVRKCSDKVVYVDSGSIDGSVSAAEQQGVLVIQLDPSRPFTAARARNDGFKVLRGIHPQLRFVQFVDGDCELEKEWLNIATPFISGRTDIALVCGRRREKNLSTSIYNAVCDLEWDTPIGEARECGGDFLARADAFEIVEGFRSTIVAGEEPELCLRLRFLGWKIWRIDAEMTRHDAAIVEFRQWWLRAVRAGYGYLDVHSLHRGSAQAIYSSELARAAIWGGGIPLLLAAAGLLDLKLVILALVYPLQISRIALAKGASKKLSWYYAFFIVLAKFAELQGALKFCIRRYLNGKVELIDYKKEFDRNSK
jgi:glycosyltransferase involved in cell wall biosynthesis